MLVYEQDPLKAIHEAFNKHDTSKCKKNYYKPPRRWRFRLFFKAKKGEPLKPLVLKTIYPRK